MFILRTFQSLIVHGIEIPSTNEINSMANNVKELCVCIAKIYVRSLSKVNHQRQELQHISDETLNTNLIHFAKIIRRFDAWFASNYLYPLKLVKEELDYFIENGKSKAAAETDYKKIGFNAEDKCWTTNYSSSELSYKECDNALWLRTIWDKLCYCSDMFEKDAKEWFLPTYYNCLLSNIALFRIKHIAL